MGYHPRPRLAMQRAYPDGVPCFYLHDPRTGQLLNPVVRHLFCSVECAADWRAARPELHFRAGMTTPMVTLASERCPWEFVPVGPRCARCDKLVWHQFYPKPA